MKPETASHGSSHTATGSVSREPLPAGEDKAPGLKVLMVEDSPVDAEFTLRALRPMGRALEPRRVYDESGFRNELVGFAPDVILCDFSMPGFSGSEALRIAREVAPHVPFLFVSGTIAEEFAVDVLHRGAADYVLKGSLLRLPSAVERALDANRKRAEREAMLRDLQASEENTRRLIDSVKDYAIFALDAEGKVVSWNSGAERIEGYAAGEIVGRHFSVFYPREDIDAGKPAMELRRAEAEGRCEDDAWRVRKDGSRYFANVVISALRDDAGQLRGYSKVSRDITERKRAENELRLSRDRLSLATRSAQIGIWEWDVEAGTVVWDEQMYRLYGVRPEDGADPLTVLKQGLHPDDRGQAEAALQSALAEGHDYQAEFRVVWPTGEVRDINAHGRILRSEDDTRPRMVGVNWDITERKRSLIQIQHLNRVHAVLSGINNLIVRAKDRAGLFQEACRIVVEDGRFPMSMIATYDRQAGRVVPVASLGMSEAFFEEIVVAFARGPDRAGSLILQSIAERKPLVTNDVREAPRPLMASSLIASGVRSLAVLPLIVDDAVEGVVTMYASEAGFFQEQEMKLLTELAADISFAMDHIAKQERLEYLSKHDELTGLANRRLFLDRIAQNILIAERDGGQLALFLLDVERFKNINDSLGWAAGDALLRRIAEWMVGKAQDARWLARTGPNQFAALVRVDPDGNAARFLEKSLEAFMNRSFHVSDSVLRVSIKAGAALFPEDGRNAEVLLRNAEAALKAAKLRGDRYLFHQASMTEKVASNLVMENQLREALEHDEFVLHYQPKVNLMTGRLTGAEALIRWNDPKTGLVPPFRFIPVLEETGLIHEVGRWAMKKAIADLLRWRDAGFAIGRIAVNVSPMQLRNEAFIAEIAQLVAVDARAAAGLELEITESMVMNDIARGIASLQSVRDMGIAVSIDDFGTGFSSLAYLAKLPIDTLKIDRTFIVDMMVSPGGLALVSAMISMAQAMHLKVVAEGVETEEQSRMLRLLRCDEMQGYLFSKPVGADVFEERFLASGPGN